jgi:hypothetical protein
MRYDGGAGARRASPQLKGLTMRTELINKYGLTVDDFGRYSDISELHDLLTNSFYQAGLAASQPRNWSDDDSDYTNAIVDQLRTLQELIFDDDYTTDRSETKQRLLAILNFTPTHDDDANFDTAIRCFEYGYADHHTDISVLAHMNDED